MLVGLVALSAQAQPVEFPADVVLASARIRAMGGAATAVAESTSAALLNPAALALRRTLVQPQRFDLDLALQLRASPWIDQARVLLTSWEPQAPDPDPVVRSKWQVGLGVRLGSRSTMFHVRNQRWATPSGDFTELLLSTGFGLGEGPFALGVLPHVLVGRHDERWAGTMGASVGGLWSPDGSPYRLGARVRTPMRNAVVRLPAQVAVGGSVAFGARNVLGRWGPEREQLRWGGPLGLASLDLVWTGGAGQAIPLNALATSSPVGEPSKTTLSVRVGGELWAVQQRARLRAGSYTIPGRDNQFSRVVATLGGAYQLLRTPDDVPLRVAAAVELWSNGYSWTVGLESW